MNSKFNNNKFKERVKTYGEVFTQEREVNAMISLVGKETERIESRLLEPACGTGNFLVPVLEKKISSVKKRYRSSQSDFEKMAFLATSSMYGIELLKDNVMICVERLYNVLNENYSNLYKENCKNDFMKSINFVLKRNILEGNALTLKETNEKEYIIFSEWSLVNDVMVKRRDFQYIELADFDPKKPTLFSLREVSDSGKTVFSPMPIKKYPLMHYLSLNYEDEK